MLYGCWAVKKHVLKNEYSRNENTDMDE